MDTKQENHIYVFYKKLTLKVKKQKKLKIKGWRKICYPNTD